ncbi:MAG: Major Facilitator Superfamily protein [Methanobacterium sp. PtaU1.Bin242]|nr:MAG: Major Facilitator Superfamily protein [Methanobacterium sp. PtaU1.Bin242]
MIFAIIGYQFSFFILSGLLIGLGLSSLLGAPVRYIMINEFPESERASGQGLININTSTGQLVGGALIGAVIASMGEGIVAYESAYLILAVSAFLITFLALGLKGRSAELKMLR